MKNILIFILSFSMFYSFAQEKRIQFVIETPYGNMRGELYNETPKHRDNFVKLVKQAWYKDSPYHRVIKDFMIQGGQNKDGREDPGYTVPAEFMPEKFIHKKGALAAARKGDQVNPTKASSGSQFYIVQGKKFNDQMLDNFQMRVGQEERMKKVQEFVKRPENIDILNKVMQLQKEGKQNELGAFTNQIIQLMESEGIDMNTFLYTSKQREIYKTIGGTPHLDGAYTVFGEITEGFDVIDKIAVVPTKGANVPIDEINMQIRILE